MTETRLAPQRSDPDGAALAASRTRSRKFKAILAGGLVLGVGAAITLAAWNDSEFATGTFTAGSFNLEGSTTGAAAGYDDHNPDDGDAAAALVFTTPFDNLAPEDVVYAPFWLRLAAGTTTDATLVVESITTTDSAEANAADLSYDVYQLASAAATCDAAGIGGGTVVASGADLATDAAVTRTERMTRPPERRSSSASSSPPVPASPRPASPRRPGSSRRRARSRWESCVTATTTR